MGGATSKEKEEGSVVTGRWNHRVVLPSGVVGQQIRGGPYPGKKYACAKVQTGHDTLIARY